MRLCVNSKAMQVKVQREKESSNGTIVTKMEQWKKIVTETSQNAAKISQGYDFQRTRATIRNSVILLTARNHTLGKLMSARPFYWNWTVSFKFQVASTGARKSMPFIMPLLMDWWYGLDPVPVDWELFRMCSDEESEEKEPWGCISIQLNCW